MPLDAVHESQTLQALTLLILVPARLARTFSSALVSCLFDFGVLSVGHIFRFPFGSVRSQEMVWYNLTGQPFVPPFLFQLILHTSFDSR